MSSWEVHGAPWIEGVPAIPAAGSFGRETRSLKACYELMQAGYSNVSLGRRWRMAGGAFAGLMGGVHCACSAHGLKSLLNSACMACALSPTCVMPPAPPPPAGGPPEGWAQQLALQWIPHRVLLRADSSLAGRAQKTDDCPTSRPAESTATIPLLETNPLHRLSVSVLPSLSHSVGPCLNLNSCFSEHCEWYICKGMRCSESGEAYRSNKYRGGLGPGRRQQGPPDTSTALALSGGAAAAASAAPPAA